MKDVNSDPIMPDSCAAFYWRTRAEELQAKLRSEEEESAWLRAKLPKPKEPRVRIQRSDWMAGHFVVRVSDVFLHLLVRRPYWLFGFEKIDAYGFFGLGPLVLLSWRRDDR